MSPDNVGVDLKKSLKKSQARDIIEQVEAGRKESVLMNPVRLRIFEEICRMPCITPSLVSRRMKFSISTAEWHMKKMVTHGYIHEFKGAKMKGYYATGQISLDEAEMFSAINQSDQGRAIFRLISRNPGSGLKAITSQAGLKYQSVRWHVNVFLKLGIVEELRDGRNKRIYPTVAWEGATTSRKRSRVFRDLIVKRMKEDRLSPVIQPSRDYLLNVTLNVGSKHYEARILLIPYVIQ